MGKCVIHPQTHNTPRQKCELPEKSLLFFPQVDRKYGYLKQQAMIPHHSGLILEQEYIIGRVNCFPQC